MAPLDIGKLYAEFSQHRGRHRSTPSAARSSPVRESNACASNSREGGGVPPLSVRQVACQTQLVVMDPKDIKQVLKRVIASSMFELLSRHESRTHARERWLLKRIKKTLGKFEHRVASLMGKSLAADEQLQQLQTKSSPTAGAVPSSEGVSTVRRRQPSQQLRHQPASLDTATFVPVQDSETACNIGALGAKSLGAPGIASLISGQSNCNNSNNNNSNSNSNNVIKISCDSRTATADSDSCIIRRQIRQTGQRSMSKRQLPPLPTFSSQGSTRTTCSVDSITESGVEPAYSGYNISTSSPFPRFPSNANCNHGTQRRPQQQQQLREQQQQQQRRRWPKQLQPVQLHLPRAVEAQKIYVDVESEGNSGSDDKCACRQSGQQQQQQQPPQQQQQQPQQRRQTPPRVNIYSPSRPSATSIHRTRPGVCQCHAAAEAASDDDQRPPQQPQQQPPHRCTRCPAKPRVCPRRRKKPQPKKPRSKRRCQKCVPGEASCGDCRPPRLVLCPAPAGRENFSRIRLQTQPGRYITRQVLFFDGSRLYGPVQPRGPCY